MHIIDFLQKSELLLNRTLSNEVYSVIWLKHSCNCVLCIGGLLTLAGGVLFIFTYSNFARSLEGIEPQNLITNFVGVVIAIAIVLIGIIVMVTKIKSVNRWNKVVHLAKSQNKFTMKEMSVLSGVSEDRITPILVEAIVSGVLEGTVKGDAFSKETSAPSVISETAKVLVICPYCGAKTEQGIAKCQKCGADI